MDRETVFLDKSLQCLAGAESEFDSGRYDNCANRCYYACFQAAIHALIRFGIQPPTPSAENWGHAFVQSQFIGLLINRRKVFSEDLRTVLMRNLELRQIADYNQEVVTRAQADRALRRTRMLVEQVMDRGGRS